MHEAKKIRKIAQTLWTTPMAEQVRKRKQTGASQRMKCGPFFCQRSTKKQSEFTKALHATHFSKNKEPITVSLFIKDILTFETDGWFLISDTICFKSSLSLDSISISPLPPNSPYGMHSKNFMDDEYFFEISLTQLSGITILRTASFI